MSDYKKTALRQEIPQAKLKVKLRKIFESVTEG